MRIGVYVEGNAREGGGFTHQLNVLKLIGRNINKNHEFIVFCVDSEIEQAAKSEELTTVFMNQGFWRKLRRLLSRQRWIYRISSIPFLSKIVLSPMESVFAQFKIDLVFFPRPSATALELSRHNYIFTVWDLCHLEHPEFPEVRSNREFERREEIYKRATKKAVSVIVDSDFGKKLLTQKYQLQPERVIAMPFLPSMYTQNFTSIPGRHQEILLKYGIKLPYIFYPAQFWAHKNHVYLLKAMQRLRERNGLEIQAVFSGTDQGNQQHVLEKASEFGVTHLVNCIGFADDDHMPYLYQGALALTMPTYFGPTNIPPLDAFALGCPVCYSDLPAFRAQVGAAAFFMDLADPDSLADILLDLYMQPKIAEEKIRLGKEYIERWDDWQFFEKLDALFTEYERKQACWK